MSQVKIGRVLLNQYRVEEFIGGGGVGLVYRVRDLKMNTSLAMKVLNIDPDDDPSSTYLFKREAKAYEYLAHPNIVRYYGVKNTEGIYFLLLDYIDGDSLQKILSRQQNRRLPIADVLSVFKALSAALGYAHNNEVVHCDIKPGNILVDQGGKVYLTDFGIARHMESTVTDIGTAGTIAYMAPEQFRREPLFASTDIYSMGVLLYEMLVGQKPFRPGNQNTAEQSRTSKEMLQEAHLNEAPPDPCTIRKDLPAEVGQVVIKAMQKDPSQRFQTTRDFYSALCAAFGVSENAVGDRIEPRYVESTTKYEHFSQPIPPQSGSPQPVVRPKPPTWAIVLGGAAVIGVIIFLALQSKTPAYIPSPVNPTDPPVELVSKTEAPLVQQSTPTRTSSPPTATATDVEVAYAASKISPRDGMPMILIPAGEFVMGSYNCPRDIEYGCDPHEVYLDDYYIDQFEVTNGRYQECVQDGYCNQPDSYFSKKHSNYYTGSQYEDYPVIYVDREDAEDYCRWAGRRLPTEAEWEKAARGTDERKFPWGNDSNSSTYANYNGNVGDTSQVGSYPAGASPYNVMDMAGNVWEWVADYYGYYSSSSVSNPVGPSTGKKYVLRGGSWSNEQSLITTYFRARNFKDFVNNDIGFRCADD